MTEANKDRLVNLFAANLEALEYESSDEKLKTLNQMNREEDELLRLAMDHAYERGYQEVDEDDYLNGNQLLSSLELGLKKNEFESSDEKLAVLHRLSIEDISLFSLAMDVAYEEGMTDAQDAKIYESEGTTRPVPVSIEEDLVDAWYDNKDGLSVEIPILVPKEIQLQGHDAVDEYIRTFLVDNGIVEDPSTIGYTQTW